MKKRLPLLFVLAFIFLYQKASTQGCVAIRPMNSAGSNLISNFGLFNEGDWRVSTSYRYFKSYKHFRGDHEESERVENGTQVINISNAFDLGLSYSVSNRLAVSVNLPVFFY